MFTGKLGDLEQALKILPGIGAKSAQRLAIFLINQNKTNALNLATSIVEAVESYFNCPTCNMLTEQSPCEFCQDSFRSSEKICIVENTQDVFILENIHEFKGRYFVLGRLLSPIQGIGPKEINFAKLMEILKNNIIEEMVLALPPSAEGETTINFIASQAKDFVENITRLSTGLPFGGDLEYTNQLTLAEAFKRRYSV